MTHSLTFGKKALIVLTTISMVVWTLGVAAFAVPSTASAAAQGSLIKSASLSAVYYYGYDGQRYTFPNLKTFETWFTDFSSLVTISDSELAAIPLAGNVVYRPGSRFVKIQSDPKTYAVTPSGALRWIETEAVATGLAGSAWNTMIDDVPEVFFVDYTVGSSLMTAAAYNGMMVSSGGNKYVVSGTTKRMVTAAGMSANGLQARFFVTPGSDLLASLTAGTDVSAASGSLNDPAQQGGAGSVTPVAGGLSVSLASDTPASMTIASGASQVRLMKFNLTANSGSANVTSVTLKLAGLGATGNISSLYLYEGNTRLTNGRSVNSTTRQAVFGGMNLAFTSGQMRTITVVSDMAATLSAGDTVVIQIEGASSIQSNATVSGSFPVTSNSMGTSATAVGTLTITDTGTISNPKVGQLAKIANFTLAANSTEGFALSRLRLNVDRSADHTMYELRQNNVKLADGVMSGTYIDFNLATPFAVASGNNREFEVYAKIGGRNGDALSVYLEETTDIYAVGDKYGYGVTVTNTSFGTSPGSCTTDASGYDCSSVQAGQLTVAFNGPSTSDIPDNKTGVVLWEGALTAANLVEVRDMPFDITGTNLCEGACGTSSENYQNFRLVRKDTGATISGPVDMRSTTDSTAAPSTTAATVFLTDDFSIPAGGSWDVKLLADTQQVSGSSYDIAAGDTISATLDLTTTDAAIFVARDTNNKAMTVGTDIIPGSDLTGNTMTIRAAALTINVASTPASQTVVRGTSNVDFVGFSMQAGTASKVTVSAITLQGASDADGSFSAVANDLSPRSDLTSCSLYDGGTGALIDGPESFGTFASGSKTDITFSGFNWTIPAGQTYKMLVRCNVANYTVAGAADIFGIEIKGATPADNVTTVDQDGNAVTETVSATAASANTAGSTSIGVTVANAGSLTVALDGDSPNSTMLLSNSTGVTVSKFKFTSSNEAFVVDRLGVSNTSGSDVAVSSVELHYKDSAGADKVATGFLTSNAYVFEGLTFYVPKDSTAVVTVKVNTGEVTAANSASGDLVGIDFDVDTTNNDQFRAVGSGSGVTLNDTDSLMADTAGSNHEIRKTKPTISLASGSPSGAAIAGLIEILRFNVTADSRGDVTIEEFTFQLSSTDNAGGNWNLCDTDGTANFVTADIYLYDSTDTSADIADTSDLTLYDTAGTACTTSSTTDSGFIQMNFDGDTAHGEPNVAAGTTKTYILKLNVQNGASPSAVQDDSMRMDLPDEVALDAAMATDTDAIVWNDSNVTSGDMDANATGAGANDQGGTNGIDGDMVKNLPVNGGSLIF